ncbi:hypothetical protein Pryu01_01215 [Paraliobacillus ryukyuensis]|uniref:Uncharacterized protein n=1 Tax=Paraliobacillus ryukyuensis TaxID=200904 RepID=A0A366DPA1_9BACI|nr:hypothetical protein [Paraliobacillus ryukyuensis]RBO91114.1 hypothetical protein DES48_1221 [Paraliobacillus ryukyuensis]
MKKNNHNIVDNIQSLLDSDITAYKIQQSTGINRSTIGRLKKGEIEIVKLSLENALKLNQFWEEMKMEIVNNEVIETFDVNTDNIVADGEHEYVLNKITFGDGTVKYEANLEVDGLGDVYEAKQFDTEEEARNYIKEEV